MTKPAPVTWPQGPLVAAALARDGLTLTQTCTSHPEQYDLTGSMGLQVAHLRLRNSRFQAAVPDVWGQTVYEVHWDLDGDRHKGCIDDAAERDEHLAQAITAVADYYAGAGRRRAVPCSGDPEQYASAYNQGYKDAREHLGDLDFEQDAESCPACLRLEDQCAFHQGIDAGVAWLAQVLANVAADPETAPAVASRRPRRGSAQESDDAVERNVGNPLSSRSPRRTECAGVLGAGALTSPIADGGIITLQTLLVRIRDGDACRYCGQVVMWTARRGIRRGTYDHLEPGEAASYDNLVVSCFSCNGRRGSLRPPPSQPIYSEYSLEVLGDHGINVEVLTHAPSGSRALLAEATRWGLLAGLRDAADAFAAGAHVGEFHSRGTVALWLRARAAAADGKGL